MKAINNDEKYFLSFNEGKPSASLQQQDKKLLK
jgi:hypothetical protein